MNDRHLPTFIRRCKSSSFVLTAAGMAALACYAAHAAFHLQHGRWQDLLWACHLGAALVGVALITRLPALNAIGVLWLCLGTPLWILYLADGGEFFPTSLLTHVVALAIGLYGVRQLGMPRRTGWKAAAMLVGLIGLSRLVTPQAANVNVAFVIQSGWEAHFASHSSYLAFTIASATGYFLVVEWTLRRLVRKPCGAK